MLQSSLFQAKIRVDRGMNTADQARVMKRFQTFIGLRESGERPVKPIYLDEVDKALDLTAAEKLSVRDALDHGPDDRVLVDGLRRHMTVLPEKLLAQLRSAIADADGRGTP